MSLNQTFADALDQGINQIGQLRILTDHHAASFILCHLDDEEKVTSGDFSDLTQHDHPDSARELGLYTPEGEYRFTKGEISLPSGWVIFIPPRSVFGTLGKRTRSAPRISAIS